ncbi:MAG: hypothetical protein GF398_18020, partial [Chitinivibrionales bacterium]|nr:hypothetical protein [Chitinivibrionales bacterium]
PCLTWEKTPAIQTPPLWLKRSPVQKPLIGDFGESVYHIKKEFDQEGAVEGVTDGIQAYHFGARIYDPEIGRWLSTDKQMQFYDAYLYCHTNPIKYVDKDGNFDTFIHYLTGRYGHPLGWISPTFGIVRGVTHALPDIYNHLETYAPGMADFFGWCC